MSDPSFDERLADLLARLTDRVQRGEPVELEEECRLAPDLASELRQLWGAVLVADAAGSSSALTDSQTSDLPSGTLELPCKFGDYELTAELGRGGMGVVYRARHLSLNREVALKMILRGQLASDVELARFRAEAEAAARLNHPSIVPVYDVGECEGRPYFTMKLIRGQTLSQRLAEGPLPERDSAAILAQVARAIQHAHQNGVLHRDLKPSNILLDHEQRPHVTDFGLAKQTDDAASLTRTGGIIGTPAYMAPEQAAGARGIVGPATDVYSLGAILYHLLTGRPPFQAASPVDTVLLLLEQEPLPPRLVNPTVDRDLELIVLRCLQKPPDLRYSTAAALANDLEAFLHDENIAARSGLFTHVISRLFRDTHHAAVLENWGLLWMWHSLVLFVVCLMTNTLFWLGDEQRWHYAGLWVLALWSWAIVFWYLRRRLGPVMFVERQIAHLWAGSMVSIALLFPLEAWLGLKVLTLSPVLGLVTGMVFTAKGGILSGAFYVQAVALFLCAGVMAVWPEWAHVVFGVVAAGSFFLPGWKYHQQRLRAAAAEKLKASAARKPPEGQTRPGAATITHRRTPNSRGAKKSASSRTSDS